MADLPTWLQTLNPSKTSVPSIAIFDFDDTLLRGDSFQLMIHWLLKQSTKTFPMHLPRWSRQKNLGFWDRAVLKTLLLSFLKTRIALNWRTSVNRFCEEELLPRISPTIADVVRRVEETHSTFIVSASPQFYLDPLSTHFGVPIVGTPILLDQSTDQIRVEGPNCSGLAKLTRLIDGSYIKRSDKIDIFATDHIRDLPLLFLANTPVAVRPEPRLRRVASEKHWAIMDG